MTRILEIPVKFQKGDIIYTTKQIKLEKECHICEGKGTITYNDKNMRCPECMGAGKFISNKQKHVVCDDPYEISCTKISINSNGDISVKYKGYCGFNTLNRAEDNLFSTKEEAQKRCDELNQEKVYINVKDIFIRDDFKATQPSLDKVQEKLDYYKQNKKFDKYIVINKDNILQDGYINYLLCGLLNIDVVRAVVE
jgi:RecJ-like exonuclease